MPSFAPISGEVISGAPTGASQIADLSPDFLLFVPRVPESEWALLGGSAKFSRLRRFIDVVGMVLNSLIRSGAVAQDGVDWELGQEVDLANDVTGVLPPANGGTGLDTSASAQGGVFYLTSTGTWAVLAKSASATRYLSNQGADNSPSWSQVDLTNGVTGLLPVGNGGTGSNLSAAGPGVVTQQTAGAVLTVSQSAAIPDVAGTPDGTYSANEQTILEDLIAAVNAILAAQRASKQIAT